MDPIDELKGSTRANPDVVSRLEGRYLLSQQDAVISVTALARLPKLDALAPERILRRVREERDEPVSRGWGLTVAMGGLLATATIVAVVGFTSTPEVAGQMQYDLRLASAETPVEMGELVRLRSTGEGTLRGSELAPRIEWTAGTLMVDVTPNRGVDLEVWTEEAVVRVVGTVFTVERDSLGVTVTTALGEVEVECVDGWSGSLTAGLGHTCLPVRASRLLPRLDLLERSGADAATRIRTLDWGLEVAGSGDPMRAELLVRRASLLAAEGRGEEALADAEAYLASEHATRAPDVRRFAAELAVSLGECGRARRLWDSHPIDDEVAAVLGDCAGR